jgi:gamma-glutamylcyclotransferase (GGCT)/AIG2-like uncharacterized protein YtfP
VSALFVYGTLLYPEVLRAVTGKGFASRPALLDAYERRRFRREPYPGIAPAPGERTAGRVYLGVDARSLARLDAFEGERYERRAVGVQTPDGARLRAFAYVVRPAHRSALAPGDWDEQQFARRGRAPFLSRLRNVSPLRNGPGSRSAGRRRRR